MSAGMAYEAMNNAGAMDSRLIVILNDNDMSIAPPVGAMSAYLARAISTRTYLSVREILKRISQDAAEILCRTGGAHRSLCAQFLDRRHAVRGIRLLLCRPDRRSRPRSSAACAEKRARRAERPDPGSCRDAEGQGLCAGRSGGRQVSRRGQVRRRDRQAGEGAGQRAVLHQGVWRKPGEGGAEGRPHRRHHRRDAGRHRARHFPESVSESDFSMSASPSSMR